MTSGTVPLQEAINSLTLAPDWLRGLILYEIATKSFTSPNGPESGTFESTRAMLPYLRELGITGIWLTGHSLADSSHFYNIWTQYAVVDPGEFDPSLGAGAEFKALVDDAHAHGIKVLLEVVTHGVMSDSPLVKANPHWFKGGSWGMTDYDWDGYVADLDEWWVDLWVKIVEVYGVDGFRLDVATYRWDLWARIRQRAAAMGHAIVVIGEHGPGALGVLDIYQRSSIRLSVQTEGLANHSPLLHDMAAYMCRRATQYSSQYQVRLLLTDGTELTSTDPAHELAAASLDVQPTLVYSSDGHPLYLQHNVVLALDGPIDANQIDDVIVADDEGQEWHWKPWVEDDADMRLEWSRRGIRITFMDKYPPGHWLSLQLSSHDDGWDGFPLDKNPYVAQGSRFVFGYGFLLAPAVPLFMAGEEFDADYRPLPQHSPRLFGGELDGEGRWLYASWLDWDQLDEPRHAAMLADVKRLIGIRKRFSHLIYPVRVGDSCEHLLPVAVPDDFAGPVPYVYLGSNECLLIAGNADPEHDLNVQCSLPLESLGWQDATSLTVTDLWQDTPPRTMRADSLVQTFVMVPRDRQPRGGLALLHVQKQG